DQPVQACPPSAWYRWGKFVRRHPAGLTISGLILVFLLAVGVGAGWMVRDRAARLAVTDERADLALKDAAELRAQRKWGAALEAVKRAQGIVAAGGSDELGARARELQRDLEMVMRLEE